MGFKENEQCNSREVFFAEVSLASAEESYHTESKPGPVQSNTLCD